MALYAAKVERTTNQVNGGANTETAVSWDTEVYDYGDFFDAGTPTRLTVPTGLDGLYTVIFNGEMQSSGGNIRMQLHIKVNGTTIAAKESQQDTAFVAQSLSIDVELVAGDYIEAMFLHGVGGLVLRVTDFNPSLSIVRHPDGT